ncbi:MAG: metallophosphoesterase family protein [Myxococcota bacterium]
MRFAVLADIHGNSLALEAVLADMSTLGISVAVNLGDHFSGPLDAAGTASLLMKQNFVSIQGNHDRWLIGQDPSDMGPSDKCAFEQLERKQLDWLASLPPTTTAFGDVFLCHGTPTSDITYWLERVEQNGVVRSASLEEAEREAEGIGARLILCGHTHIPRVVRLRDGRTVVNPGSVGCPGYDDETPVYHRMQTGTPNASYAVVDGEGADRTVSFRSIPYDSASAAKLAMQNGRDDWARALATGWFDD